MSQDDIEAMIEIRLSVNENVLSDPTRITSQMYEDYCFKIGKGWVCEDNGKVIGFSCACKEDSSIWALFIRPEYEGKGVGKTLLRLATTWLFSLSFDTVTLSTTINTRADMFYTAQGWIRVSMKDEEEVYYTLTREQMGK
jgi:GNAT superfamily N-acetyltransferase